MAQQYYSVNLDDIQKIYPNFNLDNVRIVQQTDDTPNYSQQQQVVVAHDSSELIIHEDPTQHIVYSPIKHEQQQQQYMIQEEPSSDNFIQQQQAQNSQTHQVYYNISSQNQNRTQQIVMNHSLIQQQQHQQQQQQQQQQQLVLQTTPKVVVQRNSDAIQGSNVQMIDPQQQQQQQNQTMQFHFQMDQQQQQQQPQQRIIYEQPNNSQTQQIVVQQQAKHTIYPSSSDQTQLTAQQPQYIQLQQIQQSQQQIVPQQQTMNKMQQINPPMIRFAQNNGQIYKITPQHINLQQNQVMQQQQQQNQNQLPQQQLTKVFRSRAPNAVPRYRQAAIRSTNQIVPGQPPGVPRMSRAQRPRMASRLMTPQIQHQQLGLQQNQKIVVQQPQNRIVYQQPNNSQSYILQTTSSGQQVINLQNSQHVIRVPQKIVQVQQQPQLQQFQEIESQQLPEQQLQIQEPEIQQVSTLTTSTLPQKDGEYDSNIDDLEDSITATVVTKNSCQDSPGSQQASVPCSSGATGTGINIDEYRRRNIQPINVAQQQQKNIGVVKPMLNMNIGLQQQQHQLQLPQQQPRPQMTLAIRGPTVAYRKPSPQYSTIAQRTQQMNQQIIQQQQQQQQQQHQQQQHQQQQHQQQQQQQQQQAHGSIALKELEVECESAKMLVILDNGEQRLITFTLPKETCTVQELLDQVGIKVDIDSPIECIENSGKEIDYIVKVGHCRAAMDTAAMTKAAENHVRQQQQQKQLQLQQQSKFVVQQPDGNKTPEPIKNMPAAKFVPGFYAICSSCGCSGLDHAKCERCQRVFTEIPKTMKMSQNNPRNSLPAPPLAAGITITSANSKIAQEKKDQLEALQKKHQLNEAQKRGQGRGSRGGMVTSTPRGRGRGKPKTEEPIIVMLSSDDEDADADGTNKSSSNISNILVKKNEIKLKEFGPVFTEEDVVTDDFIRLDVTDFNEGDERLSTSILCRTIRIGSHKFDSKEKVIFTTKGIRILAPSVKNPKESCVINLQSSEIVRVITHFSKQLFIIFVYTKPSCGMYIRESLEMTNDKVSWYHPMSKIESHKKIIFLADFVNDEFKSTIKGLYPKNVLEEINNRDANDLLVRSTGIVGLPGMISTSNTPNNTFDSNMCSISEIDIKKLLIYPPGRGGISINTADYMCLGSDQYLNDVIIDFYLKYVFLEMLTEDQRNKTYIFSQFFYKRLTTMTKEKDSKLSASQKRHSRVNTWTKNVNLFEKDFVIIPINEQSHWFLAIICYPNLNEPHTMESNLPIKLIPAAKKKRKKTIQIGSTTITPLNKKDLESIKLDEDELSERDEAEGDDSELGSGTESEEEEVVDNGQPVKVPCILIFDSLSGASRARVVATLRDYLSCEYRAKHPNALPLRSFTKLNMVGNLVKVPQQNNFTDCGLFLLQYVEQFFKDPIKDFRIPIKMLANWFDTDVVTRKREEISDLLKQLIAKHHPEASDLPEIDFPTKNGVILEPTADMEGTADTEDDAFDDENYCPTEEEMEEFNQTSNSKTTSSQEFVQPTQAPKKVFIKKRSLDKNGVTDEIPPQKAPKITKTKT